MNTTEADDSNFLSLINIVEPRIPESEYFIWNFGPTKEGNRRRKEYRRNIAIQIGNILDDDESLEERISYHSSIEDLICPDCKKKEAMMKLQGIIENVKEHLSNQDYIDFNNNLKIVYDFLLENSRCLDNL